jgi:hypothetical protein
MLRLNKRFYGSVLIFICVYALAYSLFGQPLRETRTSSKTIVECNYQSNSDNSTGAPCICPNQTNTHNVSTPRLTFLQRYPFLLECKHNYNKIDPKEITNVFDANYSYMQPAPNSTFDVRIIRAIVIHFPIEKQDTFESEFRWMYRSWIHMQTFEPAKWRTDLIVFIDMNITNDFAKPDFFLTQLNCSIENKRTSPEQRPMCTLLHFRSAVERNGSHINLDNPRLLEKDFFTYISSQVDIFKMPPDDMGLFLSYLILNLPTYAYLDSILMVFEGYEYFKSAGFDFLIRSDMDVFLTPAFARWLPRHCNDFFVGGGGYSWAFNRKRLFRISKEMGFNYAHKDNLGSTWISTPHQFRIASYFTLLGMAYLSAEEFTEPERKGEIGTLNWPEWHYGVLLLYGQNLGLNHLVGENQINLVRLLTLIDFPAGNEGVIFDMLHIHVFHDDRLFSKYSFKRGVYDNWTISDYDQFNTSRAYKYNLVKYYSLKLALDSKRMNATDLSKLFVNETLFKN